MFNPAFTFQRTRKHKLVLGLSFVAVCIGLLVSANSFTSSPTSSEVVPLQSGFFLFAGMFFLIFVCSFFLWWRRKQKQRLMFRKTF